MSKALWWLTVAVLGVFAMFDGMVKHEWAEGCFTLLIAQGLQRTLERDEDEEKAKAAKS